MAASAASAAFRDELARDEKMPRELGSQGPRQTVSDTTMWREKVQELEDQLEDEKAAFKTMKANWDQQLNDNRNLIEKERILYAGNTAASQREVEMTKKQYLTLQQRSTKELNAMNKREKDTEELCQVLKERMSKDKVTGAAAVAECIKKLMDARKNMTTQRMDKLQHDLDDTRMQLEKRCAALEVERNELQKRVNKMTSAEDKARVSAMVDTQRVEWERKAALFGERLKKKDEELRSKEEEVGELKVQLAKNGGGEREKELEEQIRKMRQEFDSTIQQKDKKHQERIAEMTAALKTENQARSDENKDHNERLNQLRRQKERAEQLCADWRVQHERILGAQHFIEQERDEGGEPKSKKARTAAK